MKTVIALASGLLLAPGICLAQDDQSSQQQEKPGIVAQSGAAVGQTAGTAAGTAVGGPLVGAVTGVVGGAVGGTVGKVVEGGSKKKKNCDTDKEDNQKACEGQQQARQQDAEDRDQEAR